MTVNRTLQGYRTGIAELRIFQPLLECVRLAFRVLKIGGETTKNGHRLAVSPPSQHPKLNPGGAARSIGLPLLLRRRARIDFDVTNSKAKEPQTKQLPSAESTAVQKRPQDTRCGTKSKAWRASRMGRGRWVARCWIDLRRSPFRLHESHPKSTSPRHGAWRPRDLGTSELLWCPNMPSS